MATPLVGVAIAIPEPVASEVTAWRIRAGDPHAESIPAHVTIVPPVRVADVDAVQDHLAAVAAQTAAFRIRLRGTGTFRPVSPVVFLALAEGISACEQLQARARSGPLAVELSFPFHPHVTVAQGVDDQQLDEIFDALAHYEAVFSVTGFDLYEHGADAVWRSRASFTFAV
jgi:2'-5' RNA ligase